MSPVLGVDILMLSLTATCGLLLLFHVVATHGALFASLIMTLRLFVSVVCNAAWFGNMTTVSMLGWASIGLVAAGVWIKMDRQFDLPRPQTTQSEEIVEAKPMPLAKTNREKALIRQYVVPLATGPSVFTLVVLAISLFTRPSAQVITEAVMVTTDHRSESAHIWDDSFVSNLSSDCPAGPMNSTRYNSKLRTAIATYPRSGSTYTR
jgi:hypothetical protein